MADDATAGPGPHRETVRPEWVDYNGHMNVAYYALVFDHGTDNVLEHLGLGRHYRDSTGRSVFVVESHVTYEAEVLVGDAVAVTSRVMGCNGKRLHLFHHDIDQTDEAIDLKLADARAGLARLKSDGQCDAPAEESTLVL